MYFLLHEYANAGLDVVNIFLVLFDDVNINRHMFYFLSKEAKYKFDHLATQVTQEIAIKVGSNISKLLWAEKMHLLTVWLP